MKFRPSVLWGARRTPQSGAADNGLNRNLHFEIPIHTRTDAKRFAKAQIEPGFEPNGRWMTPLDLPR
jgi:hypothetical protein